MGIDSVSGLGRFTLVERAGVPRHGFGLPFADDEESWFVSLDADPGSVVAMCVKQSFIEAAQSASKGSK